jgi:predicted NUDIX family NTP pyrophosphohydrolase
MAARKESAGILLFRRGESGLEVLLAHPGGPFWRHKDEGAWSIPKGEMAEGEVGLAAARREFEEETGHRVKESAISLGSARQPAGKVVHVWAVEDDWDPSQLVSNKFRLEWPPHSGRFTEFPEVDRAEWFAVDRALKKILQGQVTFLERLDEAVKPRYQRGT